MAVKMDLSSFMCILIMAIGCLVVILVVNVIIIVSNPENVQITSLFRGAYEDYDTEEGPGATIGQPKYGNLFKDPFYVDVHSDQIIVYPEKNVVTLRQLEAGNNAFEDLLNRIEPMKDRTYVIMVLRPKSARMSRLVRRAIRHRGIDVGQELFEAGRKIPEIKSTAEINAEFSGKTNAPAEDASAEMEAGAEAAAQ
ncbi:MAG TPA: hypothetical protein PLT67_01370 [Kiritimatiellia bacterium]|nr:hypothetical protein [Kiritimatiellia bacterium]HQQ03466.1 hypothetical protein [Kiritimatiellia bacterium]